MPLIGNQCRTGPFTVRTFSKETIMIFNNDILLTQPLTYPVKEIYMSYTESQIDQ